MKMAVPGVFMVTGALLATMAMAGSAPAVADDVTLASDVLFNGAPPAGWPDLPHAPYIQFGAASAPQGTLVADSGFRPWPNGFPMPNWSSRDEFFKNRVIYGGTDRLTVEDYANQDFADERVGPNDAINALAMRRSFGDGVCRDGKSSIDPRTGACDLTYGADLLAQALASLGTGGHCYGFAASAVALYNGLLPANQVGASGAGLNAMNPMGRPAIETIMRLQGVQIFNKDVMGAYKVATSPTELISALTREFRPGYEPFVIVLAGRPGGHSVVPYAVFDRGQGLYDVAIYDNNFPMRAAVMTVDTVADTFTFSAVTNPDEPRYRWTTESGSSLHLVNIVDAQIMDRAPCPVCTAADDQGALVAFSAVAEANSTARGGVAVALQSQDGTPLPEDVYTYLPPTQPTGGRAALGTFLVDPGIDYVVQVSGGTVTGSQPLEVYEFRGGKAAYTVLDDVKSDSVSTLSWNGDELAVRGSRRIEPRLVLVHDKPRRSAQANGHMLNAPAGVTATQAWDPATGVTRFSSDATTPIRWNAQVLAETVDGEESWVAKSVTVPRGGELVVSTPRGDKAPQASLLDSRGELIRAVPMQIVTPAMAKADWPKLYSLEGAAL